MKTRPLAMLSVIVGLALLLQGSAASVMAQPVEMPQREALHAGFCDSVNEIPLAECEALVALYNSANGPGWTEKSGWLTTDTPCSWHGVYCWADHVCALILPGNQLSGSIPPELGQLTNLEALWLSDNQLGGSIPPELGQLTDLAMLYLGSNQLSGSIPAEFGNLTRLDELILDHNQLSGSIPPTLGDLRSLGYLSLESNQLTGNLPPELGNPANSLVILHVNSNPLSGPLPRSLTNLFALEFWYDDTGLCEPKEGWFYNWSQVLRRGTGVPCTPECLDVTEIPEAECEALVALYRATNGPRWSDNDGWLATSTPCTWYGVSCADGHVTGLGLSSNELRGGVPSDLGDLGNLDTLRLDGNPLNGPVPPGLAGLTLTSLWFDGTGLCEPRDPVFHSWLAGITDLRRTGSPCSLECATVTEIPLDECEALVALYNSTNGPGWRDHGGWLTNNTPCSWYGVGCREGHVWHVNLENNQLSGAIPAQLGNLRHLEMAMLGDNYLSGHLPSELGGMLHLSNFWAWGNQLSGGIPAELSDLTGLRSISLSDNQLSGTIPPTLGRLTLLRELSLDNNRLSGPIPPGLGDMPYLGYLQLHNNQLSGSIPETFGNARWIWGWLTLSSNPLSGALPQSLVNLHLVRFWFDGTELCEPENEAFQNWLGGIGNLRRTGVICPPPNTPEGTDVSVDLGDGVTTTFGSVTTEGNTTLEVSSDPPAPDPSGFSLLGTYYDVTTTAVYDEQGLDVTLPYDDTGLTPGEEASISLLHYENGEWVDCTISRDTVANTVTGHVSSLSWLAVAVVSNQPPTVSAGAPYTVGEGGSVPVTASGSDPDGDPLTYAWDLDNDGIFETAGQSATFSAAGLDGPSTHTIAVQVTDPGGLSATDGTTVEVLTVGPLVGPITAPVDPVQVNTEVNASADFTDPGVLDTHTAVWDWGDDSTSGGAVTEADGSGSVTGSHTYTTPGVYTIRLTVTDKDGDSDEAIFQYVVIYDPEGGFVTGGGWIDSPAGAYMPDSSLTGKATFGFVAKHKKGVDVPTGQTQFQFKVADLNFHSTAYQWLVVAGPQAKFKGVGTINGEGEYGFMLTAIDAKLTPSTEVDKFRIKIWDKDTGDTIYDNQMGDADDADATTELGGGSIVIHKG